MGSRRSRAWRWTWIALAVLLLWTSAGAALGADAAGTEVRLVGVYPNPVSAGNAGEFVVLEAASPVNLAGWTLGDGKRTATFPDRTIDGRVVASTDPAVATLLTDRRVVPLTGGLRLGADGDELQLATPAGRIVDAIAYPATSERTSWIRDEDGIVQRDRFATQWSFPARADTRTTAFLLPDAPEVPIELLETATDRIRLAGYQLSDPHVVRALRAAATNGTSVDVLVDGSPVSGQTAQERAALDALVAGGVDVRVTEGVRDPYRFHHPKYAIVDDSALVMTENWKPAGTGGGSSRGWGVRVDDERVASDLAAVFDGDFSGPAAIAWTRERSAPSSRPLNGSTMRYPRQHAPATAIAEAVRVVIGPEAIADRQRAAIENATTSIQIQQVSIGDTGFQLLEAAIDAARRGVAVRVLLDHSWYAAPENGALVESLTRMAADEDLPLEARLVEPGTAFEKIHAKGLVVDERTVFVGSANWNNNSLYRNREVVIELRDPGVAAYFAGAFDADWRNPAWTAPVGLALAAAAAWLTAGTIAARRIVFAP